MTNQDEDVVTLRRRFQNEVRAVFGDDVSFDPGTLGGALVLACEVRDAAREASNRDLYAARVAREERAIAGRAVLAIAEERDAAYAELELYKARARLATTETAADFNKAQAEVFAARGKLANIAQAIATEVADPLCGFAIHDNGPDWAAGAEPTGIRGRKTLDERTVVVLPETPDTRLRDARIASLVRIITFVRASIATAQANAEAKYESAVTLEIVRRRNALVELDAEIVEGLMRWMRGW